jgi:hypothetical protein
MLEYDALALALAVFQIQNHTPLAADNTIAFFVTHEYLIPKEHNDLMLFYLKHTQHKDQRPKTTLKQSPYRLFLN